MGVTLRAQSIHLDLGPRKLPSDSQWPTTPVGQAGDTVRSLLQSCVDFHHPLHTPPCLAELGSAIEQVSPPAQPAGDGASPEHFIPRGGVYALRHLPGLFFAPGALSTAQQEYWTRRALQDFLRRPNRRNLDIAHGLKASRCDEGTPSAAPVSGLWPGYVAWHGKTVGATSTVPMDDASETPRTGGLIDDVSWATLGWQYDWGSRQYPLPPASSAGSEGHAEAKADDVSAAQFVPMDAAVVTFGETAASAVGETLRAEAGIVNYYKLTASMGGHQDIAERTYDHPVIGLSVGCGGIFLMGGEDKATPPLPLLLRSGDVLFMGGVTRLCYHGVACMLPGTAPRELFAGSCSEDAERAALQHWVRHHRLNMNVRQVMPDAGHSTAPSHIDLKH